MVHKAESQAAGASSAQAKTQEPNPGSPKKADVAPLQKAPEPKQPERDLHDPDLYLNRELTWLEFNRRVLHEAQDEKTPLLERLKFAAIVSNNLDEFFMKRIGGLKQQVGAGVQELTVDGKTPQQQIEECRRFVREIETQKDDLMPNLMQALQEEDIRIVSYKELDDDTKKRLRDYYIENIFPLVTPQSMDPAHPFPFISNLSLNLLVTLRYPNDEHVRMARVKVPVGHDIRRFLKLKDKDHYVPIDEVISNNLDLLFPGMEILSCDRFHVTRNASTERDEGKANDLLEMIESELRDRKIAPIVRMVVEKGMNSYRRGLLTAELALDPELDVYETSGMLAMKDLFQIAFISRPELHDPIHHPMDNHILMEEPRRIFYAIREAGTILLQHPYESFNTSVERFIDEASQDPKVYAIKMTLYRTSADSKMIDHLIDAAQNGKQVAVVVELKARFDEAANIRLANRMEEVGIHVTYGVVGLKTHCKVIMVVRRDYDGLRRYIHIGTGNYHADTARLYSDLGILTCDKATGRDVTELFNFLTTGYTPKRDYEKILPAPKHLKKALLANIQREIDKHSDRNPGLIRLKTNALEDEDITRALYRASQAGVKADLIVRDTCRLRPGIPGLSENIRVVGVVGRFLEHARIYYFRNGGDEEYYIGSADLMKRNLESRVEVVVQVTDDDIRPQLGKFLDTQLSDERSVWEMQSDGKYVQRVPKSDDQQGCQSTMIEMARERVRLALESQKKAKV
jgi:polyphosphate kinase